MNYPWMTPEQDAEWDEIRRDPLRHRWAVTGYKQLSVSVVHPRFPGVTWRIAGVEYDSRIAAAIVAEHNAKLEASK